MTARLIKHILFYSVLFSIQFGMAVNVDYKLIGKVAKKCGHLNWTNSLITFLQDDIGNKYLVKQLKYQERTDRWAKIVCEVVALEIGDSIGFAQNSACIIPAGVAYIGKDVSVPATLHTLVPGVRFDRCSNGMLPGLSLKQRDTQGKRIGLTRDLIYQMSRHRDFPVMVAYDTFVNNPARHKHNFFYDAVTDTFYGIDMGASFHGNLCQLSLQTIKQLLEEKKVSLSKAEINSLRVYGDTLKQLALMYTPEIITQKLDEYAQLAGLFESAYFDVKTQKSCADYLNGCKKVIRKSYKHALALIEALNQLLEKHS